MRPPPEVREAKEKQEEQKRKRKQGGRRREKKGGRRREKRKRKMRKKRRMEKQITKYNVWPLFEDRALLQPSSLPALNSGAQ